jgi:hypothetical protein
MAKIIDFDGYREAIIPLFGYLSDLPLDNGHYDLLIRFEQLEDAHRIYSSVLLKQEKPKSLLRRWLEKLK